MNRSITRMSGICSSSQVGAGNSWFKDALTWLGNVWRPGLKEVLMMNTEIPKPNSVINRSSTSYQVDMLIPPRKYRPRFLGIIAIASMVALFPMRVDALAGSTLGAVTSLVAYKMCVDAGRSFCELLIFDPPGEDVTQLDLTITYDTNKMEIDPNGFFFCDFSDTGLCPPIVSAITGSAQALTPDPGVDSSMAGPRPGTSFSFLDDLSGTLTLSYDLSSNPAPGSGPRNFFGFGLYRTPAYGASDLVEYYDVPGSYDINIESFTCSTLDGSNDCGSDAPIFGMNFVSSVPLPPAVWLFGSGLLGLIGVARRKKDSWGKDVRSGLLA